MGESCSSLVWVQWLGVPPREGRSCPSPLHWYRHEKTILETWKLAWGALTEPGPHRGTPMASWHPCVPTGPAGGARGWRGEAAPALAPGTATLAEPAATGTAGGMQPVPGTGGPACSRGCHCCCFLTYGAYNLGIYNLFRFFWGGGAFWFVGGEPGVRVAPGTPRLGGAPRC